MAYWDQESWKYFLKKLKYSYLVSSILLSIIFSLCIQAKYIEMSGSYRKGDEKAQVSFDVLFNQRYFNVIDMQVTEKNRTAITIGISVAIYLCLLTACLSFCYACYRMCVQMLKWRTLPETTASLPP